MEDSNKKHDYLKVILSYQEAEAYAGVKWRRPTEIELEQVARFFADDELGGEVRHFGREMDKIEHLIATNDLTKKIMDELSLLTMVQDMSSLDIQIFYTFSFMFQAAEVSNNLSFSDGMSRLIKRNGTLQCINLGDEIIFDI